MIYLDHNATTPIDDRVLEAMLPYLKSFYGNASGLYRLGRLARSAVDTARNQVAELVGASASQVIFTSGGTEANNQALANLEPAAGLAVSAIEHPSILEPTERLRQQGHPVSIIGVDQHGLIRQEAIDEIIRDPKTAWVSIMLANNETGVIQDVTRHAGQLKDHNISLHTDAVQAAGKIPIDFKRLGVQLLSLSSHKIYGPKGAGALVFEKGVRLSPLLLGGGQEQGYRAGTENVAAIVGFGKAAELAKSELDQRNERLSLLNTHLEDGLRSIPGLTIFSEAAPRLPNTVQFGLPNSDGEMLLMKLDQQGIAVSSGSACASGGREPSYVLTAMGVDPVLAQSALRISLGTANTPDQITQFIKLLKALVCQEG
ncbi:cysteine desulfurase family protein [Methylomicrobium sp. Wu6]|uniref:cysteine desulfurase family protein n=1 Tax=Methylomicrobium sp. Wu6 TaxID=3107928 RepID=UPI002DD631FD|nr:cysteine desulfurase family protein [Methylomicrobium sp. Wu6]MEC4750506.1 cysteine desulfurase family protein [Methylomicrobium sp. Wu6]